MQQPPREMRQRAGRGRGGAATIDAWRSRSRSLMWRSATSSRSASVATTSCRTGRRGCGRAGDRRDGRCAARPARPPSAQRRGVRAALGSAAGRRRGVDVDPGAGSAGRVPVRIKASVWSDEVERFAPHSAAPDRGPARAFGSRAGWDRAFAAAVLRCRWCGWDAAGGNAEDLTCRSATARRRRVRSASCWRRRSTSAGACIWSWSRSVSATLGRDAAACTSAPISACTAGIPINDAADCGTEGHGLRIAPARTRTEPSAETPGGFVSRRVGTRVGTRWEQIVSARRLQCPLVSPPNQALCRQFEVGTGIANV
jgi:hypothetical protein